MTNTSRSIAGSFTRILLNNSDGADKKTVDYGYTGLKYLLKDPDSRRILLYLPFYLLDTDSISFRDAYLEAWYKLLDIYDVRENFNLGDTFEPDARPNGKLDRVVKCAHLTPWLLKYGYITVNDLLDIMEKRKDDNILLRSFKDTWPYIYDHRLLPLNELNKLLHATENVSERRKATPLYVSDKRLKWIEELNHLHNMGKEKNDLLTPDAHLDGPFSPNMVETCMRIKSAMPPNQILLVGGSQLKGYGTVDSDLDIWDFESIRYSSDFRPGSSNSVHIYFNAVWIAGDEVKNLDDIIKATVDKYTGYLNPVFRQQCLERLESDLLQYRLLHKGFARFTGRNTFDTSIYLNMDGDCPFYDDEYRKIATKLFAKYVTLPTGICLKG